MRRDKDRTIYNKASCPLTWENLAHLVAIACELLHLGRVLLMMVPLLTVLVICVFRSIMSLTDRTHVMYRMLLLFAVIAWLLFLALIRWLMLMMLLIGTFTLFSKDILILAVWRLLTHTPVSHSTTVVSSMVLMMFLLILLRMSGRMVPVVLLLAFPVVTWNFYRLELDHLAAALAFDTRGTV